MVENKTLKLFQLPIDKAVKKLFGTNTIHFSKMTTIYKLQKQALIKELF